MHLAVSSCTGLCYFICDTHELSYYVLPKTSIITANSMQPEFIPFSVIQCEWDVADILGITSKSSMWARDSAAYYLFYLDTIGSRRLSFMSKIRAM